DIHSVVSACTTGAGTRGGGGVGRATAGSGTSAPAVDGATGNFGTAMGARLTCSAAFDDVSPRGDVPPLLTSVTATTPAAKSVPMTTAARVRAGHGEGGRR